MKKMCYKFSKLCSSLAICIGLEILIGAHAFGQQMTSLDVDFDYSPPSAQGNYTLSWSNVYGVEPYYLQYSVDGEGWKTLSGNTGSLVEANKGFGSHYYRVIEMTSMVGVDDLITLVVNQSDSVIVDIAKIAPVLSVPIRLNESQTISWNTVVGADRYKLQQFVGDAWATVYFGELTSWNLPGDLEEGGYKFRVAACFVDDCSVFSPSISTYYLVSPNLDVPASLNLSQTITWNAILGADSYVLQQRVDGSVWDEVYAGPLLVWDLPDDIAGGSYDYRIAACYEAICSNISLAVSTNYLVKPELNVPDNLNQNGTISWDVVGGADFYVLEQRIDGGSWQVVYSGPLLSWQLQNGNLGFYEYRVTACDDNACSDMSAVVNTYFFDGETLRDIRVVDNLDNTYLLVLNDSDCPNNYLQCPKILLDSTAGSKMIFTLVVLAYQSNADVAMVLSDCDQTWCGSMPGKIIKKVIVLD